MKPRIQYVRIDWLGLADVAGRDGVLVCGPVDGEYIVNVEGSPRRFKDSEVRIQLVKGGPFVLGNTVNQEIDQ